MSGERVEPSDLRALREKAQRVALDAGQTWDEATVVAVSGYLVALEEHAADLRQRLAAALAPEGVDYYDAEGHIVWMGRSVPSPPGQTGEPTP